MIRLTNLLAQTNPSNTFVHLATSWTKEGKPLNEGFSTSSSYKTSYQTVGSSSRPTLLSPEALQKGTKATIKVTTDRSNEAIYKHSSKSNKVHTLIYRYTVARIS